jgi:ssDNA-binding Zn-finger/Zn-ribbon topoisomerase 1
MPRDRQAAGTCAKCGTGTVQCTHNRFVNGAEQIDSWEHRCASCDYRDTQAKRHPVDVPDEAPCPFCGRQAG